MSRDNKVKLKSSEGTIFEVDKLVAYQSQTLKVMIGSVETDTVIPLPNVSGKILSKVIEYCRYHAVSKSSFADKLPAIQQWDAEFMKVSDDTLYHFMQAANYLNIENLLELTCKTFADIIKVNSPEDIRRRFNIKNDFTPEEEEKLGKENGWCTVPLTPQEEERKRKRESKEATARKYRTYIEKALRRSFPLEGAE